MKRWPVAIAFAAFFSALCPSASSQELPDLVRALNSLQNRMAMGDKSARRAIMEQSALVELAIVATPPDGWAEERNVRAAALYLLCGGAPGKLREIYDAQFVPTPLAPLLEASLAQAETHKADALSKFDAREFPPILGGHIALIQGDALLGVDKQKALTFLDLARLLTPESLVEEAALRHEINALDPAQDAERLIRLAERYLSCYAASPSDDLFWR
ncbi:MAG: hypothetical protein N2444_09170, partial [Methylocystis sp.]|nr:hypothetical protein [Methylocystis sp.]